MYSVISSWSSLAVGQVSFLWCGFRIELVGVGVDTNSSVDHLFKFCDVALCIGVESLSEDANAVFVLVLTGDIVKRG